MSNYKIDLSGKNKYTFILLINLMILAAAFGYIEGVFIHFYNLFSTSDIIFLILNRMKNKTMILKMSKNFAIILSFIIITQFTKGSFIKKIANFIFMVSIFSFSSVISFAVISKNIPGLHRLGYIFLIPIPGFSQIIAPVLLALCGIAGSIIIHLIVETKGKIKIGSINILLGIIAIIGIILSYSLRIYNLINWILFITGFIIIIIDCLNLIRINFIFK